MNITANNSFLELIGSKPRHISINVIQKELSKLPQYTPKTEHFFHGGMYCRKVYRDADVLIIGAVHKKEHFYVVASGTVAVTDGASKAVEITGPAVILSKPGTKRAVLSITEAVCMTFHKTDAATVEEAEAELVEEDPGSMFLPGNIPKQYFIAPEGMEEK